MEGGTAEETGNAEEIATRTLSVTSVAKLDTSLATARREVEGGLKVDNREKKGECHICSEVGHFARECPKRKR